VKIRFQADADLNEDIVAGVLRRLPEIDFQTAREAKLARLPDPEVLAKAAAEGRILITHDRKTLPIHFGKFIQVHSSPGVLIVSQKAEVLRIIEDLILIWFASDAEEYMNSIRTLPL
jgi:predicted nuclease of predicted toxin-antitoxin system